MQVGAFQKIMDAGHHVAQVHEINGGYGQIDWVSLSAMSKSKGVRAGINCVIFSDQSIDGIKNGSIRRDLNCVGERRPSRSAIRLRPPGARV
jgi:hypothetical protein